MKYWIRKLPLKTNKQTKKSGITDTRFCLWRLIFSIIVSCLLQEPMKHFLVCFNLLHAHTFPCPLSEKELPAPLFFPHPSHPPHVFTFIVGVNQRYIEPSGWEMLTAWMSTQNAQTESVNKLSFITLVAGLWGGKLKAQRRTIQENSRTVN